MRALSSAVATHGEPQASAPTVRRVAALLRLQPTIPGGEPARAHRLVRDSCAITMPGGSNCWTRPPPWAWEQAGRKGLQQELAPSFERAAGHLAVLRRMTGDFCEPVIWLLLASLGIYMFWWFFNQMDEPNKHFTSSWAQEDDLVNAIDAIG